MKSSATSAKYSWPGSVQNQEIHVRESVPEAEESESKESEKDDFSFVLQRENKERKIWLVTEREK